MRAPTPWHVWLVGALAVLWNGFGALDYVMTQTQNADYLAQMTPEQTALFTGMPIWATAAWAIAIWSSVAGSVLLLFRNRFAVQAFLLAIAGMAISFYHNLVLESGADIMGTPGVIMTAIIVAIAIALWAYARWLRRHGVIA